MDNTVSKTIVSSNCICHPWKWNQFQVQTPVIALNTSHMGYVMPMLDGRT